MRGKHRCSIAAAAISLVAAVMPAHAETEIRVLGLWSNIHSTKEVEKPFFENLPKESGGKFKVTYRSADELNLKGFEAVRMLKQGAFDIMAIHSGYVSGDEPFTTGMDLPGLAPDLAAARKMLDAYREPLDRLFQQKYGGKVVALSTSPGQIFWCNGAIRGLDDFKGKKIRVFSPALSKLVTELGGIAVSISFPEVYQSLQRGVADCAITGSTGGNSAKWFEVTNHLYTLSVGWSPVIHVASTRFWSRLNAEEQQYLSAQLRQMENRLWDLEARTGRDSISCNTGGECKFGAKASMTLVRPSPADEAKVKTVVVDKILRDWVVECEKTFKDCRDTWNASAGQALGVTAKN